MIDDFETIIDVARPQFGPTVALVMTEECAQFIANVMDTRDTLLGGNTDSAMIRDAIRKGLGGEW